MSPEQVMSLVGDVSLVLLVIVVGLLMMWSYDSGYEAGREAHKSKHDIR